MSIQQTSFEFEPEGETQKPRKDTKAERTGTFISNLQLPIHKWFRYSAGFSAEWASEIIGQNCDGPNPLVFDPFAGSGTTILAAESLGVRSVGLENHQFVHRIANTKLKWHTNIQDFLANGEALLRRAQKQTFPTPTSLPALLEKCYSEENLLNLMALRETFSKEYSELGNVSELLWLAITSILRECSFVGTAQWQYVLPKKRKAKIADPYNAFSERIKSFAKDMLYAQTSNFSQNGEIRLGDTRTLDVVEDLKAAVSLVVCSPPYPNNYDYADATRLEMTFWGEVEKWGDLQPTVRHRLIRSCSQHSAAEKLKLDELLSQPVLSPIISEIERTCRQLEEIREHRGGRKTYHTMIAAYFIDLANVWIVLRQLCREGAKVCFVVGDVAPYGVYAPVDEWLGELALAAGFSRFSFKKIRDRNIKWKNRKHRVPLKEGHLWVEG